MTMRFCVYLCSIYPGHVMKAISEVVDANELLSTYYSWTPIYEGGVIIYDILDTCTDDDKVRMYNALLLTSEVKERKKKRWKYVPDSKYLSWLPIYDNNLFLQRKIALNKMLASGKYAKYIIQEDEIIFFSKYEPGAFLIHVAQRIEEKDRINYLDNPLEESLNHPMEASRVRLWIVPHKKPKKDTWNQLQNVIERWLCFSKTAEPPLNGVKGIKEAKLTYMKTRQDKPISESEINEDLENLRRKIMQDPGLKEIALITGRTFEQAQNEINKYTEQLRKKWIRYSKNVTPQKTKKIETFYCELDMRGTYQEAIESLIAMLATFSETIFPIKEIIFA